MNIDFNPNFYKNIFNPILMDLNEENKKERISQIKNAIFENSDAIIHRVQAGGLDLLDMGRWHERKEILQILAPDGNEEIVHELSGTLAKIEFIATVLDDKKHTLDDYHHYSLEDIRKVSDSLKSYLLASLYNKNPDLSIHSFFREEIIAMSPYLTDAAIQRALQEGLARGLLSENHLVDVEEQEKSIIEKNAISIPELVLTQFDYTPEEINFHGTSEQELEMMADFAAKFYQARQEGRIDVRQTHLSFLSHAIMNNFEKLFTDEILRTFDSSRLELLESFRNEMMERIDNKKVTYEWWLFFNFRLSILVTHPRHHMDVNRSYVAKKALDPNHRHLWRTHEATLKHFDEFTPSGFLDIESSHFFLYPTCLGELQIADMNQTYHNHLYPIGLITYPTMSDGFLMQPSDFFLHDLDHHQLIRGQMKEFTANSFNELGRKFNLIKEYFHTIGQGQQELAQLIHFVYFLTWHDFWSQIEIFIRYANPPGKWHLMDCDPRAKVLLKNANILGRVMPLSDAYKLNGLQDNYYLRADYFLEAIPSPKSLGFSLKQDMFKYGIDVLQIFLESKNLEEVSFKISQLNQRVKQEQLAKEAREEKVKRAEAGLEMGAGANGDEGMRGAEVFNAPFNGENVILNREELDLYNAIVHKINAEHDFEGAIAMAANHPNVHQALELQGITRLSSAVE